MGRGGLFTRAGRFGDQLFLNLLINNMLVPKRICCYTYQVFKIMSQDNRRQFPRFNFDKAVQYKPYEADATNGALGRDISLGGIKITVNDFIPLGAVLEMGLDFPELGKQVVVKGKVVWVRENPLSERFDVGLSFIPDEQTEAFITAFLKKQKEQK